MITQPIRHEPRRSPWRLPASVAVGISLFGAAGYCWDTERVAHASAADAIAVLQRSHDSTEVRGACITAFAAAENLIAAIKLAAKRDDAVGRNARACLATLARQAQEPPR